MQRVLFAVVLCLSVATGASAADDYSKPSTGSAPRYTFSWPLDGAHLKPRGGTTKGAPVTVVTEPTNAWKSLQAGNLTALERDRRAILAMAGTYRVTFDFLEVVSFKQQDKPNAPYQSWGTEKVYVDQNDERFISLVHILEMRMVGEDGKLSEPMVTKHWRQDWQYEPTHIVQHTGRDQWVRRKLAPHDSKGVWSQTVYQVDESPRYASVGRWEHTPAFSTWLSAETWRPLPRREWSVRDDYQALIGTNRHTVLPTGWIQEENNLKAALTDARKPATTPYVGREYGVARYEAIRDMPFADADEYYVKTRAFWGRVRDVWVDAFAKTPTITLRGPVDKLGLYRPLFAAADGVAENNGELTPEINQQITAALKDMGALK